MPQLPWGHLVVLIQKVRDAEMRTWYADQTIENGWSRTILEMQIDSGLYERQAKPAQKINNLRLS